MVLIVSFDEIKDVCVYIDRGEQISVCHCACVCGGREGLMVIF